MSGTTGLERALRAHFSETADRTIAGSQLVAIEGAIAGRRQRRAWIGAVRHLMGDIQPMPVAWKNGAALRSLLVVGLLVLFAAFLVALLGGGRNKTLENGRVVFGRLVGQGDPTIFTINPDGTDLRAVAGPDGSPVLGYPALSRDGRLGVTGSGPGEARPDLPVQSAPLTCTLMDLDGSRPVALATSSPPFVAGCGIWSPDGTSMVVEAFDDVDPSRNGLYRLRPGAGGSMERLTTAPYGHDIPIAFSPDGAVMAFACATRPVPVGILVDSICVATADGRNRRSVTTHTTGDVAVGGFTVDGRSLVLSREGEGTLFIVDLASGRERPLVSQADPSAWLWEPRVSPDGSRVLFGEDVGGCTNPDSHCMNLFSMRLDGTDLVRITNEPFSDWFPDWGPR